jgi:hypothetical protein
VIAAVLHRPGVVWRRRGATSLGSDWPVVRRGEVDGCGTHARQRGPGCP